MSFRDVQDGRLEPARERRSQTRRVRFAVLGSLVMVAGVVTALVLGFAFGSGSRSSKRTPTLSGRPSTGAAPGSGGAGRPGSATVPILAYHVINVPPSQSTGTPGLYVPAAEFASQMDALKATGWHAVTLDQLQAYWTRGVALGPGKPIVITFDNGYASQYTNAAPVLRRLGWAGVENLQVNGLPPAEGGLSDAQLRPVTNGRVDMPAQAPQLSRCCRSPATTSPQPGEENIEPDSPLGPATPSRWLSR